MLYLTWPEPPKYYPEEEQRAIYRLYNEARLWITESIKSICLDLQSERFLYKGVFYGSKHSDNITLLPEQYHEEIDHLNIQYERLLKEARILEAFGRRSSLNQYKLIRFFPKHIGGGGEETIIPEIQIMYARILKNKILG